MVHISGEIFIEQFLCVPSLSLYRLINDKNLALKLLFKNRKTKDIIKNMNKYEIEFLIDVCYFDNLNKKLIQLAAEEAGYKGYKNIVNKMIKRGANNFDVIAYRAVIGGHKDIIYDMIERGTDDFDWIAKCGAMGGHKNIVNEMIEKGANNFNMIAYWAAREKHKDIVDDMIKRGANDFNMIADGAAVGGYEELANHIREIYM